MCAEGRKAGEISRSVARAAERTSPAMVETLPASWIAVKCPLCSEHRRYLPTEVFQGRASNDALRPARHRCAATAHLSSLVSYLRRRQPVFGWRAIRGVCKVVGNQSSWARSRMDSQTQDCSTRRDFEERRRILTRRLGQLTSSLIMQIGEDHQKFLRLSAECREINQQITESRRQLQDHKGEHGC
jgi:hypothetical protein